MIRRARIGAVVRIGVFMTVALLAACARPTIPTETAPPQEPVAVPAPEEEEEVAALPPVEETPAPEEEDHVIVRGRRSACRSTPKTACASGCCFP